jgi:hypothetical protein
MVAAGHLFMVDHTRSADAARARTDRTRAREPALLMPMLAMLPALLLHVIVGARGAAGSPTAAEASTVAAAHDPTLPAAAADIPFLRQLALLDPLGGADLLQSARLICLIAGVLTAVLLWPVARRVLERRDAAAVAVVVAGSTPIALLLHAHVDAGAFAALWLVGAAAVATSTELRSSDTVALSIATVLAGCAVLTAPVAAVGMLAVVAQRMATRLPVPGGGSSGARRAVGAATAAAAVALAALAVSRTSPTTAADPVAVPLLVATVVLGGGIVALAHRQVVELRALSTAAAAWFACALWPGPVQLTALLLALPAVALLAGALVDRSARRVPVAAGAAVAVALTAAVFVAATPDTLRPSPTHDGVARWVATELDPATPLQAGALDRVELVSRGVAAARFVTGPAAPGTVRVVAAAAGCGGTETLLVIVPGPAGGTVLCRAEPADRPGDPAAEPAPAALAPGFGAALASNPALTLSPSARAALFDGRVDARLAMVLAGATAQYEITIEEFPSRPDATLRTSAVVARADSRLRAYFAGQLPPYRPELSQGPGDRLLVSFSE